ncbi:MAG: ATP-dependent helicase [Acutalibacteraceae bacterium]
MRPLYTSSEEFCTLRREIMNRDFTRMNNRQREAVFHANGALLILAGAGSGKTTVLVNRAASLIRYGEAYSDNSCPDDISKEELEALRRAAAGDAPITDELRCLCAVNPCPAWQILTITFTNKAAGELKERLCRMLGSEGEEVVASTFHSFCARIMRREGERLGFSSHFTIYDTQDSQRLMKECLKQLGIEERFLSYKSALGEISRAKDRLLSPADFAAQVGADFRLKKVAACYELYEKRLSQADAMDFDDLLCKTVELFEQCPDVLEKYQRRFRYIMVDEYQDTNHAQYRLVSLLAGKNGNLCVVGDDDQSIYKFRGATIENILNFEQEFRGCKVIRLEQNYRSTKVILDAANRVIEKNQNRKGKTLWTDNAQGEQISWYTLDNEDEEARLIAETVQNGVAAGRRYRDFAVLYRARAQSNAIERALVKSAVPYRVIGGHRFYDTQEVRDAMAYLRVINNPADDVSLRRIINTPKRGIGETTVDHAAEIASQLGQSLYEVIAHAEEYPALSRAAQKLKAVTALFDSLRERAEDGETLPHELYREMLEQTGYLAMWEMMGETEAGRVETLQELESSLIDYEQNSTEYLPSLAGFLEEAALMTDVDNYDADADTMVLMTMHAAKGLEFPVVFLPGFEDGIFPGRNSLFQPEEMEEERRLCYVGITRAKERLYITCAKSRMLFGMTNRNRVSRFFDDIPAELISEHDLSTMPDYMGFSDDYGSRRRGTGYAADTSYRQSAAELIAAAEKNAAERSQGSFGTGMASHTADRAINRQKLAAATDTKKASAASLWSAGDVIRHKVFGRGTIQSVSPMGNDCLLTIAFDTAGVKKIMANFVHLEKEE